MLESAMISAPSLVPLRRFRPTAGHPLLDPDAYGSQGDWQVFPVQRSLLSSLEDISNFETALKTLGGVDNPDVEIMTFRHWIASTTDVIAVRPDTDAERVLVDLVTFLAVHGILDDVDLAKRLADDFEDRWVCWASRDFAAGIVKAAEKANDPMLTEQVREWLLWDVSAGALAVLYRTVSCGHVAAQDLAAEVADAGRHLYACLGLSAIAAALEAECDAIMPVLR